MLKIKYAIHVKNYLIFRSLVKKDSNDGYMSYCKSCCSKKSKMYRLEPKNDPTPESKVCNQCSKKLEIKYFWNSKSNKDGKDNKCKHCHKEKG